MPATATRKAKTVVPPPESADDDGPATETLTVYRTRHGVVFSLLDGCEPAYLTAVNVPSRFSVPADLPDVLLAHLVRERRGLPAGERVQAESPYTENRRINFVFADVCQAVLLWPAVGGGKPLTPTAVANIVHRDESEVERCLDLIKQNGQHDPFPGRGNRRGPLHPPRTLR